MNNKILNVICFAAGAATGWLVACKMMRQAFMEKYEEDVAETREEYLRRIEELEAPATDDEIAQIIKEYPKKETIKEYVDRLEELKQKQKEDENMGIEVISPEEFGEYHEYETITLHYYSDGIVSEAFNDEVEPFTDEDIEECLGTEALESFGQYEEDSVFVRNDNQKTYYEILAVDSTWAEDNIPND